jgi:hypothetical protein
VLFASCRSCQGRSSSVACAFSSIAASPRGTILTAEQPAPSHLGDKRAIDHRSW